MKHTSLYLEEKLLAEAERALGTKGPTTTVRSALEEVVRRHRLASLAAWDLELQPEDLGDLRRPRMLVSED